MSGHTITANSTVTSDTPLPTGTDVHDGLMTVSGQRLYNVVAMEGAGVGRLSLRFDSGIHAYSFTFG